MKSFLKPHIYTNRLIDINYDYLKCLGIEVLLIDKDDTLTLHHNEILHRDIDHRRV